MNAANAKIVLTWHAMNAAMANVTNVPDAMTDTLMNKKRIISTESARD